MIKICSTVTGQNMNYEKDTPCFLPSNVVYTHKTSSAAKEMIILPICTRDACDECR